MSSDRLIGKILLQGLSSDPREQASANLERFANSHDLNRLVETSIFHRISNHLYLRWRDSRGATKNLADHLSNIYERSVFTHLSVIAELGQVSQIFAERDIPWLVVKGPILAEVFYPRPDLRTYSDLDLVIPRPLYPTAIEALEDSGYRLLDLNWRLLASHLKGQLHLLSPRGVLLDVHWSLINDSRTRNSFQVDSRDLFESAGVVDRGRFSVPTPGPSEHLVYLAVHACLSGGERLIWMKDVQQVSSHPGIDWNAVGELAEKWRVQSLLGLTLDRTRRLLTLPVGEDEIQQLTGSRHWLRAVRLADRLSPPQAVTSEGSPSRIVARSTRNGFFRSTLELIRRSTSWVASPGRRSLKSSQQEALRSSAYVPSGDPRDREEFFASVAGPPVDD